ncbi:MAG TPA: DUF488 domain-containing protein [Candidatus Nanopelagicaceae bacterium]|nr:DUF488 domain-containing protein [Candidatus Nanopelagicaceae bacterium]
MEKRHHELAKFTKKIKTTYIKGVKPEEFTKTLEKLKVNVVVDIRYWSLYPIYFSPKFMRDLLEIHGIEYVKYKALGNPSSLRRRAGENFIYAKQLYQDYVLGNPESNHDFLDLFKQFRFRKNFCLICYCPTFDVKLCHRFWLKELLINVKRQSLGFSEVIELQNYAQKLTPEVSI